MDVTPYIKKYPRHQHNINSLTRLAKFLVGLIPIILEHINAEERVIVSVSLKFTIKMLFTNKNIYNTIFNK